MNGGVPRNPRFDWAMAIASFYAVIGLYTDLWYHIRHNVDTFFTVQHGVLYSSLILLFGSVIVEGLRNYRAGVPLRHCLPPGYGPSFVGMVMFFVGGCADLVKHETFGFERDYDALLNPVHLTFGIGIVLAVCGPLRSAMFAPRARSFGGQLPAIISAAALLELMHWATNPFFRPNLEPYLATVVPRELTPDAITLQTLHMYEQGSGIVAFILQSLLMTGSAIYLVRNFRLVPGSLTVLFLLGNGLISVTNALSWGETVAFLAASIVAGILGDLYLRDLDALRRDRLRFAAFAFTVPAAYHAALLVFTALFLGGVWWDPSIAAGAVIDSGVFGLFLGVVAFTWQPGTPADAA
jgi:hypothetical protein